MQTGELATGTDRRNFIIDKRLTEIDFGEAEGKRYRELGGVEENFFTAPQFYKPEKGGESLDKLVQRTRGFMTEQCEKEENGNILVVSHGTAIHAMLITLRGQTLKSLWEEHVGNCDCFVFEKKAGKLTVLDNEKISVDGERI